MIYTIFRQSIAYDHSITELHLDCAGGILEIFLFIFVAGLVAHVIGAGIHEGIFIGALVGFPDCMLSPAHSPLYAT